MRTDLIISVVGLAGMAYFLFRVIFSKGSGKTVESNVTEKEPDEPVAPEIETVVDAALGRWFPEIEYAVIIE